MVSVSAASLTCMGISAVISISLPFVLYFGLRHRCGLQLRFLPVVVGSAAFILGAMVVEQFLHLAVFSAFPDLRSTVPAYVAYGVLAAGVCEETARLVAFSLMAKHMKTPDGLGRAVSYGIGHGGTEAILTGGLASISTITMAAAINKMGVEGLLGQVPDSAAQEVRQQIDTLTSSHPALFLVTGWERLWAVGLHIALSILVWLVVSGQVKKWWFGGAIAMHAITNVGAALYQTGSIPMIAAELVIPVCVVLCGVVVYRLSAPAWG